jgi:hypothetical protein
VAFAILKAFKETMVELGLEPHQITVVSGIGQAAKLPHYTQCNTFNGLHGRALPAATGIRLANHAMPVIVTTGDGDCYGEGGNHLMAAIRRNINVKCFVHDNQIYGLTKGQPSPTTGEGTMAKNVPHGVISEQFNPMALAVALDCNFAARAFVADAEHPRTHERGNEPQRLRAHRHPSPASRSTSSTPTNGIARLPHQPGRSEDRAAAFRALNGAINLIGGSSQPPTDIEERLPVLGEQPIVQQALTRQDQWNV